MGKNPPPLSAKIKGSFAYFTVKDRLPIILTRVIDHLCRQKVLICEEYGQEVAEEIKMIVGHLSQLKNEMQTNKPLGQFSNISDITSATDNEMWNRTIQSFHNEFGTDPKWFTASWLFVECYLYKKINEVFKYSHSLNCYDPFRHQKIKSCENASEAIKHLSEFVMKRVLGSSTKMVEQKKDIVFKMVQVSLWGNQCDLSISSGEDISPDTNPFLRLKEMKKYIICSEEEALWEHLNNTPADNRHIALILDNAGLELVADLCLATLLTELKFATSVTFYTKTRPWFVSDTILPDLNWTLEYLSNQGGDVAKLSAIFKHFVEKETWKIKEDTFWTGPQDFSEMREEAPHLYQELSEYSLIIFKGDLNYRKLVGDLDWPNNTSFRAALRGFLPSSLVVLRTVKGGPVVGLDEASVEVQKAKAKEDWFKSGEIGLIQFVPYWRLKSFHLWIMGGLTVAIISFFIRFVM